MLDVQDINHGDIIIVNLDNQDRSIDEEMTNLTGSRGSVA